jgi:hypothetical protein
METSAEVPQKTQSRPTWPHHTTVGIYPKDSKSMYGRDACTATFIAALFTTANIPYIYGIPYIIGIPIIYGIYIIQA